MKKITIFLIFISMSFFSFADARDLKFSSENEIKFEDNGCLSDAIMIYDATLTRTGDRARSLDNAMAYYDFCMQRYE